MKNFHLPLPERTYNELLNAAKRSGLPATAVARDAISLWLRARKKLETHNAIAAYAADAAGTEVDLDPRLETAAIEHLMQSGREKG
jgi:hypothetical protein